VNIGGDYDIGRSVYRCVCPLVCVFECMMTNNGNDVIAPTVQAAMPAVTLASVAKRLFLFLPFPCVFTASLGGDMHSHEPLLVYLLISQPIN